jgi:integration host factor subunit beta
MTKADLIAVIEKQANLSPKQAEKIVNICFDSMIQSLYDDERIEIRGFGSFANRNYKAYEGRNPKTGKVVIVEPKKVPFFKVGKELKEMVNLKALEMFNEWFKSKKEKHLKKLMISDKDYKELKEMVDEGKDKYVIREA